MLTHVTTRVSNLAGTGTPYEADFLVDTGAVDCLAPTDSMRAAGIRPESKAVYELANGEPVEYEYGFAEVRRLKINPVGTPRDELTLLNPSPLTVSVSSRIEVVGVCPHAALRFTRPPLELSVAVMVGGDSKSFPHHPFTDVSALAGHSADYPPELIHALDRHTDMLAANFLNERALHASPVVEPVSVLMFGLLIPFGRVKSGEAHFLSGHPYPVAVGHIRFARDRRL